jgi:RNA-directed DNA polymerase
MQISRSGKGRFLLIRARPDPNGRSLSGGLISYGSSFGCQIHLARIYSGRILKRWGSLLKWKTRRDRMQAKLTEITEELPRRIPEQGPWLPQVVRGCFAYAVPTNFPAIRAFHSHVGRTVPAAHAGGEGIPQVAAGAPKRIRLCTLRHRSQKDRMTWERIKTIAADYLPKPKTLHPWPQYRFAVMHPRWEPRAGIPLAQFCAGGGR